MAKPKITMTAEDKASAAIAKVGASFNTIGQSLDGVNTPLLKFQSILGAITGGAVVAGLRNMVGALDDLDEAAQGLGLTARSLSELRAAAVATGVASDQLDKALSGLSNRLSDTIKGGKESTAIFAALGISVKNTDGSLRATDDVLADLADRFSKFRDSTEKTALANQIFGDKLGRVVIPYLNQGREALKQYSGVTDEAVREAAKLQGEFDKLALETRRWYNELAGFLIPELNKFLQGIRNPGGRFSALGIDPDEAAEINSLVQKYGDLETARRRLIDGAQGMFSGLGGNARLIASIERIQAADAQASLERFASGSRAKLGGDPRGRVAPTVKVEDAAGITDAQRALAQYVEQLQGAIDRTNQLSESEKAVAQIRAGAFGQVTPQVRQLIMQLAEQADATKALREIEEKAEKDRQAEEAVRAQQREQIMAWEKQQREDLVARTTAQGEALLTETEALNRERQTQLQIAIDAREADLLSEEEYQARRQAILERYGQAAADVEARRLGVAKVYRQLDLQSAGAFFGQMSGLMNSQSRKLFEVGKAAAIGETVINTYSAAMAAYKSLAGIPIVGPALGAAAAAAAVVSGMANIQRIKSTQFGGGSATAIANVQTPGQGPFNVPSPAGPVAPREAAGQAAPARPLINLNLQGSWFSAEDVRRLINDINGQGGYGAEVTA